MEKLPTSCGASGRPLHRLLIHSSAVSLSQVRMLTRWCRGGFTSCSLNNIPLVSQLRLSLLRSHVVVVPKSSCDFVPTFHGFARAGIFSHALTTVCVVIPSICSTFEIVLSYFLEMMHRGLTILGCLIEVPCQTSCPDFPMQTAQATHHLFSMFLFIFSACNTGRMTSHVQKDFPLALCSLHFSHRVVASMTTRSVMSVFPCLRCNSAVRASTSVTFFLTLNQLFFQPL